MSVTIKEYIINRVCIIDDDDFSRESLEYTVEDAKIEAFQQVNSVQDLLAFFDSCTGKADAFVSDHHLKKKKNYFPVNGAEFVAQCYERKIPSLLVTKYEQSEILDIRRFRSNIPVVLTPNEFIPENFLKSLELIIDEFSGIITPERKEWRTLVRIDDIDINNSSVLYAIIPAWSTNEVIRLYRNDFPVSIRDQIIPDYRLHAKVNIGASRSEDLFFRQWEVK